jgi:Holliday junction resolvasome RuvABC endonuclease subunit
MNFLGLDLSLTATGVSPDNEDTRTLKVGEKFDSVARLALLRDLIVDQVRVGIRPDVVVLEGYSFGSRYNREALAELGGVVRLALFDEGLPITVVPPGVLKKFATGRGTATKTDMAIAAYKRAGMEFEDDNQCDAWWARQMGVTRYEPKRGVDLPAAQREVVNQIPWPPILPEAA